MYKKQQSTINAQKIHNQFDFFFDAIRNQNIKSHNNRNICTSISLLCQFSNKSNKLYKLFQLTMIITLTTPMIQEFCSKHLFISQSPEYTLIEINDDLGKAQCSKIRNAWEAESVAASPLDSEQHWTSSWNHSVQPLAVAALAAASLCFALCRPIWAGPITMWPQFGCEQW